jgi:UDP-glucose 4-epimerase
VSVLVTGAAGFIGAPLAAELLRRGERVVGLDDFSIGAQTRLPEGIDVVSADLRDRDAVRRAVGEAEPRAVVHLAARHFVPWCEAHPEETRAVNVEGTRNLVEALAGDGRLVFASTGDVYAPAAAPHRESDPTRPEGVYGESKLAGEELVAAHPSALSLRLFNVYGPGETNPHVLPAILEQLRRGDTLRLGNVDSRRDFVFVGDAVAAIAALLARPDATGALNVAGGEPRSVTELVDRLGRLTGRRLEVELDPRRMRRTDRAVLAGDAARLRGLLPELRLTGIDDGLRRTLAAEGLV